MGTKPPPCKLAPGLVLTFGILLLILVCILLLILECMLVLILVFSCAKSSARMYRDPEEEGNGCME